MEYLLNFIKTEKLVKRYASMLLIAIIVHSIFTSVAPMLVNWLGIDSFYQYYTFLMYGTGLIINLVLMVNVQNDARKLNIQQSGGEILLILVSRMAGVLVFLFRVFYKAWISTKEEEKLG
ncbi:MAG: hypothetical protein AAF206_32055 [Bacteroidota bacterium]